MRKFVSLLKQYALGFWWSLTLPEQWVLATWQSGHKQWLFWTGHRFEDRIGPRATIWDIRKVQVFHG